MAKTARKCYLPNLDPVLFLVKPHFWKMRRERQQQWRQKIPNWHFFRETHCTSWRNNDRI